MQKQTYNINPVNPSLCTNPCLPSAVGPPGDGVRRILWLLEPAAHPDDAHAPGVHRLSQRPSRAQLRLGAPRRDLSLRPRLPGDMDHK